METFEGFARRLGIVPEKSQILLEAITHRTYAVEHKLNFDNQRLEFLGDAVLELIQTDYLFCRYPQAPEGDLTKIRSALVREATLAKWAMELELGKQLRIGRGEMDSGGQMRLSTLADMFEAVLGAIYLTAGYDNARKFVINLMENDFPEPWKLLQGVNPKGTLQEFSQQRWGCTPVYKVLHQSGEAHKPFFQVEVSLKCFVAIGNGTSRKIAETDAACRLHKYLNENISLL